MNVNWKRGFLRIWVLISTIWISLVFIVFILAINSGDVFYSIPDKSELDKDYQALTDSYNCKINNIASANLESILNRMSNDIHSQVNEYLKNTYPLPFNPDELDKMSLLDLSPRERDLMNEAKRRNTAVLKLRNEYLKELDCDKIIQYIPLEKLTNSERDYINKIEQDSINGNIFSMSFDRATYTLNCKNSGILSVGFKNVSYISCFGENATNDILNQMENRRNGGIFKYLYLGFLPPAILFIFGLIVLWVINGFSLNSRL